MLFVRIKLLALTSIRFWLLPPRAIKLLRSMRIQGHVREYADEIADLKEALEEEQATKESLEETFTLELSKI
jgi:hypothetical protein